MSISSHKAETISILSLADLKCTLKTGLCYFEWENDCHSNFLLNQTGASWWTQQSFTGRITAQSSVGTRLVHFFDVQAPVRLCMSAQASTLVQDHGQEAPWNQVLTHFSESYSLHHINVSTLHSFLVFLVFFFWLGFYPISSRRGKEWKREEISVTAQSIPLLGPENVWKPGN